MSTSTQSFEKIVILFNPNSTGKSKANAQALESELARRDGDMKVDLIGTEYAGHGEEIAQQLANSNQRILLISSSGDGGYNEIINGVMHSKRVSSKIVVSVIPSGNANDHYHAVKTDSYVQHIISGKVQTMDVLQIRSRVSGKSMQRYAHSYIGIGMSAVIGRELSSSALNFFNEKLIVVRGLLRFRYVVILEGTKKRRYSSLIFSNIGHMSKVLTLSNESSIRDGKMEVTAITYRGKLFTIFNLMRMLVSNIAHSRSVEIFSFITIKSLLVQCDGEDFELYQGSLVEVTVCRDAIRYIA